MTLASGYDFDAVDEHTSFELAAETPKLPFDANDYHMLELNHDFIVPSADFINDYSSSSPLSGASTISEAEGHICNDDEIMASIEKAIEDYTYTCGLAADGDVRSGAYSPLFTDETLSSILSADAKTHSNCSNGYYYTFGETESNLFRSIDPSLILEPHIEVSDGFQQQPKFKINNYNHPDFRCGVITNKQLPCKNKITCTFHTEEQKSCVPRGDSLPNLMENLKYLQNEHYGFYNSAKASMLLKRHWEGNDDEEVGSYRLKRHNSCDLNQYIGESLGIGLIVDDVKLQSTDNLEEWLVAPFPSFEFSTSLALKLAMVPSGIEERLAVIYERQSATRDSLAAEGLQF